MKKAWLFGFNFVMFAGFAFVAPFLVLYYQSVDFTGLQIGILTGVTPLIYMVSAPLLTGFADSTGYHRRVMGISMGAAILIMALFPFAGTFLSVLLLIVTFNIFFAPVMSFIDSATMYMLGDARDRYGRIRLGGTLGWALIASVAGVLVQAYGLRFAFWGSATLFTLGFVISWKLRYNPATSGTSAWTGVRRIVVRPLWIRFLALAFVGGLAFAVGNNFLFPYMAELGAPESLMGIALTIGTLTEIPALFYGNRLLGRLKAYPLLLLALAITGLRLVLFGWVNTPALVLAIQLLGGLTFPVMWIAGVAYADAHAPEGLNSTAQGLFAAMIMGFGSAVGGMLGGLLLERMTAQEIFFVVGLLVFVALAAISGVGYLIPSRKPKPV